MHCVRAARGKTTNCFIPGFTLLKDNIFHSSFVLLKNKYRLMKEYHVKRIIKGRRNLINKIPSCLSFLQLNKWAWQWVIIILLVKVPSL